MRRVAAAGPPAAGSLTAGRALVDTLAELGARHLYCVPGESFLEVLEAARRNEKVTLVSTRHESGASFMAEADAKLTGLPAIAAATRGPGAANLAIGVQTALEDSTPLIALLGQVEHRLAGEALAFQSVDLESFYRPITKWVATLRSPDGAVELARAAFAAATTGRPGPVARVLPADVQTELVRIGTAGPARSGPSAGRWPFGLAAPSGEAPAEQTSPSGLAGVSPATARGLARRLATAERPVIIVGGRTRGCAGSLVALAEALGIGVYAAFRRQDRFPNDHPAYLGHLTTVTPPAITEALVSADLVVALGCRLSEITTQRFTLPPPSAAVVHIDQAFDAAPVEAPLEAPLDTPADASVGGGTGSAPSGSPGSSREVGPRRAEETIVADVAATIAALVQAAEGLRPAAGLERFAEARRRYLELSSLPPSAPAAAPGAGMHPFEVMAALTETLPEDCILANDAGNFALFVNRYWRYRTAGSQLAPTSGAMGYAVPAAIAAALWRPERLAVAVVGDGGYLMTGNELETAARLGAKLVVVVMRNGLYGTIALHQARTFGALAAVAIGAADLAAHARSLGAHGFSARDRPSLDEALREAISLEGPVLIDAVVDPDVLTPELRLADLL